MWLKIPVMRKIVTGALLLFSFAAFSQKPVSDNPDSWKKFYRAAATKINDLFNTKLDVRFDYSRSWMYGKEWVTLHPHFYPTDSLNLDAKGMNINEVSIIKGSKHIPLKYIYDSLNLHITLDKTYKSGENYTIFIDYISKPNDLKSKGSMAITSARVCILSIPWVRKKTSQHKYGLRVKPNPIHHGFPLSINPIRKQLMKSS